MCCIFTCCGWMVDLIQRLWVFLMSCCISSAVGCVMVTSSMSGIALGYNYSLAEYIELKETNVSIYLKRGIFDDEVGDDMQWRRSGHQPRTGHLSDDNLRTGASADETTSIRSGRRLDDSVFEADDQNKYEGSLMKLTAKPVHLDTPKPLVTEDFEMAEIGNKYPQGSLDHLKAVQTLIDSRRRMASGGTTLTPLATYGSVEAFLPYLPVNNNPNEPGNRDAELRRMMGPGNRDAQLRRMMGPAGSEWPSSINPARLAVPDESIGSIDNWVVPKNPFVFKQAQVPDYFVLSPTYPSAITVANPLVRPSSIKNTEGEGAVVFVTRSIAFTSSVSTNAPSIQTEKEAEMPDVKMLDSVLPSKINEIQAHDLNQLPKVIEKSSEEEYEDEIKGLPVRRRRNVEVSNEAYRDKNTDPENQKANSINDNKSRNDIDNQKAVKDTPDLRIKHKQSLLDHLITTIKLNKPTLEEVTPNKIVTTGKNKELGIRGLFESKIVSSKYVPNDEITRFKPATTVDNQELLSSTVNLNDVRFFQNPATKFVKLLQSA
ncbi:hypothetical protein HW555_002889 [Spodoptera exigua]|uniref:Uncharacterized protein n=1 Tax=Spodoptera exigua TaxID=7107 RepID=A0A835GQ72_SPOEX|nr:hypothetical protein HW555_002889 [Spodoptera exigua]